LSASVLDGGWPNDVVAPSAIAYNKELAQPTELSVAQIKDLVVAFADATRRSLTAGVDVIEVHSAHGYLLSEFLSPQSNQRTDDYGGSFENRTRLLLEIVDAVRAIMPSGMPLFVR
jgi:2,4-dienoyl-CoA reductase-like NADH-dependent reductase (Old Yellow Enzyme family)